MGGSFGLCQPPLKNGASCMLHAAAHALSKRSPQLSIRPRPLATCSTQSEGEPPRPVAAASGSHRASLEVLLDRGAVALGPAGREGRRVAMKPFSPKHTSIAPPPSGSAPPFARHHAQCSTARSRSWRVRGLRQRPRAGRRELHPSPHRARAAGHLRTVGASRGERCVGAAPGARRCGGDAWHGHGRRSRPRPLCATF